MATHDDPHQLVPADREEAGSRFVDAIPESTPGEGSFGAAVGGTVLGTFVPGTGLFLSGHRRIGAIVLSVFLAGIVVLGGLVLFRRRDLIGWVLNPAVLQGVGIALVVIAFAWVGVVILTHVWLLPARVTATQRGIGALLVAVLSFVVAAPLAIGSIYATASAESVREIFKSHGDTKSATRPSDRPTMPQEDPWKDIDRVNVLLLGGDSDGGKRDGVRTDTVMVASIDTTSGNVTLISLPRNTGRMPFPEDSVLSQHYPYGFSNGVGEDAEFMLNAMYGNVPAVLGDDILGETDNVGADVMKLSVGEALGLHIDYYALIDIKGFSKMIDALGGITVNINEPVAMGGSTDANRPPDKWLEPGPDRHLNGNEAMWFARGRYGSDDFDRMDRQRCVIDAMVRQINPTNVVSRYEAIVREGGNLILTDITQEELPAFVELAMRVKDGKIRSMVFKHGERGFFSSNPDYDLVRERVATALDESAKPPTKKPSPSNPDPSNPETSNPDSSPGDEESSPNDNNTPGDTNTPDDNTTPEDTETEDTEDACAYLPPV